MVIIPKPGKPDYSIPKAYRPVSLLNCLGKTVEKIMATRMAFLAEKNKLLHKWQIGGRANRSAVDAVLYLTTLADQAKQEGHVLSTLCMDVKGDFDTIHRPRLVRTLSDMRFPRAVIRWTDNILTKRKASLQFDGEEEEMAPVQTAIPQGSLFSPIIFMLYIKPLLDRLEKLYSGRSAQATSTMWD